VPAQRHVRHILVKTKAQAEKLYAQLKTSDKTSPRSRRSTRPTRARPSTAATLKMIQKGQTVPTFDAVAFKEPVKQVSAPVKSTYGYHLIEALGPVTPPSTRKLDGDAQGVDQDAARRHRQAEEDQQLAERREERSGEADHVRAGLRPRVDHDQQLDRHHRHRHRIARAAGRARRRARPR